VVSLFVNPTQFGPAEDFAAYPRDSDGDRRLCEAAGVDALYHPAAAAMYAEDFSTWVNEESLSRDLCGASRPGHFRGVTTVVAKLFNAVGPDVAVFGQKDAQQALVIERMVRDLDYPVRVIVAPTVREADGLAMSSRNRRLSAEARQQAPALYRGLCRAREAFENGERRAAALEAVVAAELRAAGARLDYVTVVSRRTLRRGETVVAPALVAAAAFLGDVRLIDNLFLD